jgi:two-component system, LytTR family, sensor kinase
MKYGRHILFWLVYCSYFYVQSISPQSPEEFSDTSTYSNAFVSLCSFIPVCMLSVYVSIYYILPHYIETKKYGQAITAFIILFAAGTIINYQAARVYYHFTHVVMYPSKGTIMLGYLNTVWAMIISGIAICIRITRKWLSQRKEIEAINRQKARNELNLQKNRIHPAFLYSSLDHIYADLKKNKGDSSSMILLLSNVLSYSLYESKTERITLERELNAVADYIALEKMKGSDEILVHVDENVATKELLIPPMLIVSALREGFAGAVTVKDDEQNLIIEISMHQRPPHMITIEKIYQEEYEPA